MKTSLIVPWRTNSRSCARSLGPGGVDAGHRDAQLLELGDLVLDQRQQGRYHQRGARQHQRGQLIGHRLAAARGQHGERVPSGKHRFDDRGLARTQLSEAEDLLQLWQSRLQGGRRGALVGARLCTGGRGDHGDDGPSWGLQRAFGLFLRPPDDQSGFFLTGVGAGFGNGLGAGGFGSRNRRRFPACVGTQSLLLWETWWCRGE